MANFPLPKGYQRLGSFPLDETNLFTSLAALEDYALNNGSSYAGQFCAVNTGTAVTCYQINFDKTVSAIGASGSAVDSYVHNQLSPSAVWTITHDLNKRPSYTVIDSVGDIVVGTPVYDSASVLTITFSAAISGIAYLS